MAIKEQIDFLPSLVVLIVKNYFRCKVTTSISEGMNKVIKTL